MESTSQRRLRTTVELPAISMADMMDELGGHEQPAQRKVESYATECAITQHEMPAMMEVQS